MIKPYKAIISFVCFATIPTILFLVSSNVGAKGNLSQQSSVSEDVAIADSTPVINIQDTNTSTEDSNEYKKYCWDIELKRAQYNISRSEYETREPNIPNFSGSNSILIGEFSNDELMAFYHNLHSRFGDSYFTYFNFKDYIYMSSIDAFPNAPKYFTKSYFKENESALQKAKDIRGDDFQYYNPELTTYQKKEYILLNENLFLLDHVNKSLIYQNREDNLDYEQLMIEIDRILDVNDPIKNP